MADDKPVDPSVQFQEYVTQWERSVDQFFNQMMGTEQFSQQMNQVQQLQLEFQRTFKDAMASQLLNFNMPSRDDLMQLSENVREIDARLARIEEKLTLVTGNQTPAGKRKSPPRTKKPPIQED